MKYILAQLRLVPFIAKIEWQGHITYRLATLIWIINGFITPAVLMGIWLVVRQQQQLSVTSSEIVTYYLLTALVVRLTQSWIGEVLGFRIKDGELSNHLIKPLAYWTVEFARDLALKGIRLLTLAPFIIFLALLFKNYINLQSEPLILIFFIISIVIGYLLNFLMQGCVGLLALWLQHTHGANTIYSLLTSLFSGMLIPLFLMPSSLQTLSIFLPFHYLISLPIEIIMGKISPASSFYSLLAGALWLFLLAFLQSSIYSKGIKKYTAVGI